MSDSKSPAAGRTTGIAGRYATALFELADEAGALSNVESDLNSLAALMAASPDLDGLVRSPLFSRDDQRAALGAVLKKAGAHALTQNFVSLVASNRRLFALRDMIAAFAQLAAAKRGEIRAEVTSARALSEPQTAALKAALKESTGQDVQLDAKVDESLIGGLMVKVGSRMVDSSLRTKLTNLKIAMKEAG